MNAGLLDFLPLWALCLATIAVGFLSVEAGYRLGRLRRRRLEPEQESSVGVMVAATLGLLAFTLAFTFGVAAGRFDARQQFILDEAIAIRTSYLRSAFLRESQRSTIRGILRQYLEARLEAAQSGKLELVASQHLHDRLWAEAIAAVQNEPSSVPAGLFIESLNDLIALHAKRVQATLRSRIPGVTWATLYFVAGLAMAGIGYHEGLTSLRRSPALVIVVLTFSAVIYLIADLDRPEEGLFNVSQQAMVDLRNLLDETSR
jgi:Protein of unknown function (DUF4239)